MICQSCRQREVKHFNDLCPICEANTAAQRKPATATEMPGVEGGTTRVMPRERQHQPLPGGDTGRLRDLLKFFGLDGN